MFVDHLQKTKKEYKNYKNRRFTIYLSKRTRLDKVCFQNYMAYRDFQNLTRRTASDKILPDKSFSIARNPKYY